ncbi:MAG: shikimate dehydrogenase [Steroidobacteraceae bacterium]
MTDKSAQFGVVGYPIGHSWSPFIHGLFAKQTGHQFTYRLFEYPPDDFRSKVLAFFARGGNGLNVTVPHKRAAAEIANELTPRAERAGSVNTLARQEDRILGDNTDGGGLVRDLRDNLGLTVTHKTLLIIGAGGATRGILGPLLALDPAEIVIANRNIEKANGMAAAFCDLGPVRASALADLSGEHYDYVINATSAGLSGEVPEINPGVCNADTICYDLSYSRTDTPFIRWAKDRGCINTHQGWGMLVEQAAESYWLWHGVRPETLPVLAALAGQTRDRSIA